MVRGNEHPGLPLFRRKKRTSGGKPGWPGEPRRHAMAARGLRSKAADLSRAESREALDALFGIGTADEGPTINAIKTKLREEYKNRDRAWEEYEDSGIRMGELQEELQKARDEQVALQGSD